MYQKNQSYRVQVRIVAHATVHINAASEEDATKGANATMGVWVQENLPKSHTDSVREVTVTDIEHTSTVEDKG